MATKTPTPPPPFATTDTYFASKDEAKYKRAKGLSGDETMLMSPDAIGMKLTDFFAVKYPKGWEGGTHFLINGRPVDGDFVIQEGDFVNIVLTKKK